MFGGLFKWRKTLTEEEIAFNMALERKIADTMMRDQVAIQLLHQFIQMGYPSPDPLKQIVLAFQYAQNWVETRRTYMIDSKETANEGKCTRRDISRQ